MTTATDRIREATPDNKRTIRADIALLRAAGARVSTIIGHDPSSHRWHYGITMPETITSARIGRHPVQYTRDNAPVGRTYWHRDGRLMVESRDGRYVAAALQHLASVADNLSPLRRAPGGVCVGYDREPHSGNEMTTENGLCPACTRRLDRDVSLQALIADWQQRAAELSIERDENTYDPNGETDDAIADAMHDCATQLSAILNPPVEDSSDV
jgi:hypothetical protein